MVPVFRYIQLGYPFQHLALKYAKISVSMSVIGDTSAVISSLELSDANYDVVWSILREQYDNKRVIVQTHISAVFDLPIMTRENAVKLRRLSDNATKHLHALQALKRLTMHWDDLLVHLLTLKLDSLTLREWRTSLAGNELPSA